MTVNVNVWLTDSDLPAARQVGTGRWLELHGAEQDASVLVRSITQARALNSAAQQILREMREEEKAAAARRRDQVTANGAARPEFRPDLLDAPAPVVTLGACVFCGHVGPLKPHHGGDLVCTDDAACLARGWKDQPPAVAAAGLPPAGLDSVTGRAPFAGYQTVRTYTCGDCGGHGTMPSHRRDCHRYGVALLRNHKTTGVARQALLAYQDSPPTGSPHELPLADALRALLALIDAQAGAV